MNEKEMMIAFRNAGFLAITEKVKWADVTNDWQAGVARMRAIADTMEKCCAAMDAAMPKPPAAEVAT